MSHLNTLFIGRNLLKEPSLTSTNSYLSQLSSTTSLPEGTVVVADFQTSGRGQLGTGWFSDAGKNLLLSILLKPAFLETKKIFLLSKALSLAIKDTLEEAGIEAKIKWPNDIYVDGKKICGVLIENTLRGTQVQYSIAGIGLNVNQESFPAEIPNPVSMKLSTGKTYSLDDCLSSLCNHFEKRYLKLKAGGANDINKEYLASLTGVDEKLFYRTMNNGSQEFQATIEDVEDEGLIALRKEDGSVQRFTFKEIKLIG